MRSCLRAVIYHQVPRCNGVSSSFETELWHDPTCHPGHHPVSLPGSRGITARNRQSMRIKWLCGIKTAKINEWANSWSPIQLSCDDDIIHRGSKTLNVTKLREDCHDDVIKWKHFPRYWPFVQGIHWSAVNSPHKGQWRRALIISLICAWTNDDLRHHCTRYGVTVMWLILRLIIILWLYIFHCISLCGTELQYLYPRYPFFISKLSTEQTGASHTSFR